MRALETSQVAVRSPVSVIFFRGPRVDDVGTRMDLAGRVVEVVDRWEGDLGHLPAMLVECAADPVCRTFAGVCAILSSESSAPIGPAERITALVVRDIGSQIQIARKMP